MQVYFSPYHGPNQIARRARLHAINQGHLLFDLVALPSSVSDSQGHPGVDIKLTDRSQES